MELIEVIQRAALKRFMLIDLTRSGRLLLDKSGRSSKSGNLKAFLIKGELLKYLVFLLLFLVLLIFTIQHYLNNSYSSMCTICEWKQQDELYKASDQSASHSPVTPALLWKRSRTSNWMPPQPCLPQRSCIKNSSPIQDKGWLHQQTHNTSTWFLMKVQSFHASSKWARSLVFLDVHAINQ